jgi:segregation and condensation protein A
METETSWQIKQEGFEGPIEVLLELIEKRKVFVGDISLAAVTDDFVKYVEANAFEPNVVAQFLSVAATLILIKARSLLPTLELTTEENESIQDLERRVAIYGLIVDVSNQIAKRYGKRISFEGASRLGKTAVFAPDEKLTPADFVSLALGAIVRVPPKDLLNGHAKPEVRMRVTISMKDVLATLEERINRALKTSFNAIRMAAPEGDAGNDPVENQQSAKVYTIISFLGILELARRGYLKAEQETQFGDIELEREHRSLTVSSESVEEPFE